MTKASTASNWPVFVVCLGVACLTILDITKINIGLPAIESDLSATSAELQLLVAGFSLAMGLALVPAGRVGDLYSRRAVFLTGLALFTTTSAVCAMAPDITWLVIARIVEGIGAGILMPQVLGYIQQLFSGAQRGRAFGAYGAAIGVAAAIGPAVAGILVGVGGPDAGWRLMFWMNVPLGAAGFALGLRLLPKPSTAPRVSRDIDFVGVLLLGIAVLGLMLPFTVPSSTLDHDPQRWLWLVLAVVAFFGFVWWERRYRRTGREPAVPLGLFRIGSYRNGLIINTSYFAAATPLLLLATLFLQQGLGLNPALAGTVTISFALGSSLTAWLSGRWVYRWGPQFVTIGFVTVLVGVTLWLVAMVTAAVAAAPWLVLLTLLLGGLGAGLATAPNQTVTLTDVPPGQAGLAGSLMQVGQRVGTAVGISVASAVYYVALANSDDYRIALVVGVAVCLLFFTSGLIVSVVDLVRARSFSRRRDRRRRPWLQ